MPYGKKAQDRPAAASPRAAEEAAAGPVEEREPPRNVRRCPNCQTELVPYEGENSFKAGTYECPACVIRWPAD